MTEECAYCGGESNLTRDHIPPKSIFSKPLPSDLITVSCCLPCNREWSKHDEYFQLMMKMGVDPDHFPLASAASVRTIGNLARPESIRYARYLWESFRQEDRCVEVDSKRIGFVLHRIVRGLYYHHARCQLPPPISFRFWRLASPLSQEPGIDFDITPVAESLITVGHGEFRYLLVGPTAAAKFATFSILEFYRLRRFFA